MTVCLVATKILRFKTTSGEAKFHCENFPAAEVTSDFSN